jgi:putative transposase
LERIILEGARELLQEAIEHKVSVYIDMFKDLKDDKGRRLVVRHGSLPERALLTGVGSISE